MKKLLILLVIIFVLFVGKKDEIKVRVVSNSNSVEDIEEKNLVKVRLEELINESFVDVNSYQEMKEKIEKEIDNISDELNKITNVNVSFKNHNMGIKSYNGKVIIGSSYTLLVEIKEAKGDNWWGTLYPSLLGISTDEKVEYKFWIGE